MGGPEFRSALPLPASLAGSRVADRTLQEETSPPKNKPDYYSAPPLRDPSRYSAGTVTKIVFATVCFSASALGLGFFIAGASDSKGRNVTALMAGGGLMAIGGGGAGALLTHFAVEDLSPFTLQKYIQQNPKPLVQVRF